MAGKLYVVATPIGNYDDLSKRAIKVLEKVEYIACEDTRVTGMLLKYYNIDKKKIVYQEHNKEKSTENIINLINEGNDIALVTDAGTPCISDPGYYLVKELKENKINILPIPGPSAGITALSVSGFATDRFLFEGFLSGSWNKKEKRLRDLIKSEITFIIYESPYRVVRLIETIVGINEKIGVFVAREITKKYEEFISGRADEVLQKINNTAIKGEFVVIVNKYTNSQKSEENLCDEYIYEIYSKFYKEIGDKKRAMKKTSKELKVGRNDIYKIILNKEKTTK